MADVMLTTTDNPWNPFTNFEEWYAFDEGHHYCTCGLIARFSSQTETDSDEEAEEDRVQAIDRVLELFPFGPLGFENDSNGNKIYYKKVTNEEKLQEMD